ncbi:hypothetical protein [uncultured Megasphaera sp.]|uniref:hypothetical protein n=1 Tax=uncultured Megasphaera sp. TaxID=165188 RepID=UPI00266BE1A6|nr:hypothetical protein [uncultured Megasphaera sp.]
MEEIIERLQKEAKDAKQAYTSQICEIVVRHIKAYPSDAERITSDKTLIGCFAFLKNRARQNQSNGCGICGDKDVYEYFNFEQSSITSSGPELLRPAAASMVKPQAIADFSVDDLFD